jgi:hypothetical protein
MTALVVFDTCTKPNYYADVHQLLALPARSYLRYDYEEKLFTQEAFDVIRKASAAEQPIDVFLFYGQLRSYEKGQPDPEHSILHPENSFFIPTRYAFVRNVALEPRTGADGEPRTNVIFHMELMGFPDPDEATILPLMNSLSARRELPFWKWIAAVPRERDLINLRQSSDHFWGKVVGRLARKPSQFNGDVFWRIDHLEKITGGTFKQITPTPRTTNKFGDKQFFADYTLDPMSEYRVSILNIIPESEDKALSSQPTVTAVEDTTTKLLVLPELGRALRRNDGVQFTFNVNRLDELRSRYTKLKFDTAVKDHQDDYPSGSSAEISLEVRPSGYKIGFACCLVSLLWWPLLL